MVAGLMGHVMPTQCCCGAQATEAKMADAMQKANEEAAARQAAEAARRWDAERRAAELFWQLGDARAAKLAADAEVRASLLQED